MTALATRRSPVRSQIGPIEWSCVLTVVLVLLFGLAELVVVGDVVAGFVLHCLLLVLLVNQHLLASRRESRGKAERSPLFLALALLPLLRILSLTMPVDQVPRVLWPAAAAAPLVVAMLLLARQQGWSPRMPTRWHHHALVAAAGIPLGGLGYLLLPATTPLRAWSLPLGALVAVATGVVEEVLFRGVLQSALRRQFGSSCFLLTAAASSAAHVGTRSAAAVAFCTGTALLFGWLVERNGAVVGVAGAHGILNLYALALLPLL